MENSLLSKIFKIKGVDKDKQAILLPVWWYCSANKTVSKDPDDNEDDLDEECDVVG